MPDLCGFLPGHHRSWWFTIIPCLPTLARVITITVVVPASLSTPRFASATCAGTAAITCAACGLLAHFGPVCQLQTLAVRGVFIPIDFRHWDLLPVLFLEVGNKFPYLVGTPTSTFKSFSQHSCQTMVNKEGLEHLSSGDVGWACWQGEMDLLLHAFRCLCSLHRLWVMLVWTLIRRVLQHHLPVHSPRSQPALSSSSCHRQRFSSCVFSCSLLCTCHVARRPPPHGCTVKGLYLGKEHSSFI